MSQYDIQFISETKVANYVVVAFVMALLYDYLLTFGEEVEFVWQQRMSLGKILFLLNRYIPMIDLVVVMNSWTNPAVQQDKLCVYGD